MILVHASYPPGHPALRSLPWNWQVAVVAAFTVLVSFPVNAFILLSFLGLSSRLEAGVPAGRLVRAAGRRLVPAYLFWTGAFLAVKALHGHDLPSPRAAIEAVVLGQAAAHLYFVPHLLALTLGATLLQRVARSPRLAVAVGCALSLLSLGTEMTVGERGPWLQSVIGFLGLAPFALAGLALARVWHGIAPPADVGRGVAQLAGGLVLVSACALVFVVLEARAGPVPLGAMRWLGNLGCALGVPLLLVTVRGPLPARLLRLAPYTLGVYLIHPFFIQGLRLAEARVPALADRGAALILPNALLTALASLGAVALLAQTPLRRIVI